MRPGKLMLKNNRSRCNSQYMFGSSFEQQKTFEYLRNLIHSKYLHGRTTELFAFACTALGKKIAVDVMLRDYPDEITEDVKHWITRDYEAPIPSMVMRSIMKQVMVPAIEKKLARLTTRRPSIVWQRALVLQKTFDLINEEIEMIVFYYLIKKSSPILRDHFDNSSRVDDFSEISKFRTFGDVLLGISRAQFLKALSKGSLFKANLMEKADHNDAQFTISAWCSDYLTGIGPLDISTEFYDKVRDEPLKISDFEISKDELMVLDTLMKSSSGNNILFYGSPGTGKSSFAKSLAKKHSRELLCVRIPEENSVDKRVRGIYATVNFADKKKSIVLIDEADEIVNTAKSHLFDSATNKSWVNTFLDTHGKKVIWITNRSSEIDPSTMRRFAFTLEFKRFDPQKRLKVLKHELRLRAIPDTYFTEEELSELCKSYNVNAAGIVSAIDVAAITKKTKKEKALRKIQTVLANHEKAIGAIKERNEKERTFDRYSLEGLSTSLNLHIIVASLKQHAAGSGSHELISILLHGMPGTGKTEFVYYLGHILKKEVILKRASEIQSMWVGQTEKNIATAFAEGRETGGVLFFDEADSFLYPRKDAIRSWEKSHTNEILTQLENHRGIVVFSTNDIDGLDHAALRRFGFKIRFDPLTPEGTVRIYESMLMPLVPEGTMLSPADIARLRAIPNLTPGDIAVVRDQAILLGTRPISHENMIASLENEVRYKKSTGTAIGF